MQHVGQFGMVGLAARKIRAISFPQHAYERVAMLHVDLAILVAMAIVEAGLGVVPHHWQFSVLDASKTPTRRDGSKKGTCAGPPQPQIRRMKLRTSGRRAGRA
jgi:hypothetical protein